MVGFPKESMLLFRKLEGIRHFGSFTFEIDSKYQVVESAKEDEVQKVKSIKKRKEMC
jgi:hypothetical protein